MSDTNPSDGTGPAEEVKEKHVSIQVEHPADPSPADPSAAATTATRTAFQNTPGLETSPSRANLLAASMESVDTDMLARAVAEAGRWAFGIMAVDVWVLAEDQVNLYQPTGGFWIDPVWALTEPSEALERLSDPTREDYCHPMELSPGEGLGGALWNDVHPGGAGFFRRGGGNRTKSVSAQRSARGFGGDEEGAFAGTAGVGLGGRRQVVWRDVNGLANDPDQPHNEKVKLLAEAGFGLAAAVPFNVRGHRGIVVYLGRASVDPDKVRSEHNEDYLRAATDSIGAVSALRNPRQQCIMDRREEARSAIRRMRTKLLILIRSKRGKDLLAGKIQLPDGKADEADKPFEIEETPPLDESFSCTDWVSWAGGSTVARFKMWSKKLQGGGVTPPPVMPLPDAAFSLVFSFIAIYIILAVNDALKLASDNELFIILGPISSLQTMGFALTQAPAAQPRNLLLANILSVPTAIILRYIYFPLANWKTSLTVGLTVFLQASTGVTHPPATAMAALFALSTRNLTQEWRLFGIVLLANLIVITTNTVFNDLSQKRQYPTSWGYIPAHLYRKHKKRQEAEEKKEKET